MILDATLFTGGSPELPKCEGLYPNHLWSNFAQDKYQLPDQYPTIKTEYGFVDIEHWFHSREDGTIHGYTHHQNINRYIEVMERVKQANPNSQFSYYSIPGFGPGDFMGENRTADSYLWADLNTRIAQAQDYLSPSIYVAKDVKPEEWYVWADKIVNYLSKFNKPILPFIWWEYKDQGVYLGDDFWYMILDFCKENCDGALLWGGYQQEWDENASFYKVLKEFI